MKIIILISVITVFGTFCFSQEKLSELTIPTSPAASAVGIQPNQILNPKSFQALETALYSNFFDASNNVIIPKDFALEFTPFWANDHGMSLKSYLFPTFGDQFKRNSSFSIASTQNFMLGDSTKMSGIGYGYRTSFFIPGQNDKNRIAELNTKIERDDELYIEIIQSIDTLYMNQNPQDFDSLMMTIRSIIENVLFEKVFDKKKTKENFEVIEVLNDLMVSIKELPFDNQNPDEFYDKLYILIANKLNLNIGFEELKSYITKRQGFSLDIAYAGFIGFPTGDFEFSYLPHNYFWLTPTYNFKNRIDSVNISFSGVVRFEKYNLDFYNSYFPNNSVFSNNINYGLGISAIYKKFSLQLELIGRESFGFIKSGIDTDGEELFKWKNRSDIQYIGTFNYNINESIVLTYSIGNRFDPIRNPESTFISTLSINFGFGGPDEDDIIRD
jgi:hypothetical protein